MSKVYLLIRVQTIPAGIEKVWNFFSSANNLSAITPPGMGFTIISGQHADKMYAGQVIEYKVKPVAGISVYWMTEITHVHEHKYFVDEQRFGPYSMWHHQHHFREVAGGIEMTDLVHYKIPYWFIGDIAHFLFVKNKLAQIFDFRREAIEKFNWQNL